MYEVVLIAKPVWTNRTVLLPEGQGLYLSHPIMSLTNAKFKTPLCLLRGKRLFDPFNRLQRIVDLVDDKSR